MSAFTVRLVFMRKKKEFPARVSELLAELKPYILHGSKKDKALMIEVPAFTFSMIEPVTDMLEGEDVRMQLLERDSAKVDAAIARVKQSGKRLTSEQLRAVVVKCLKTAEKLGNTTSLAAPAEPEYDRAKRILRKLEKMGG